MDKPPPIFPQIVERVVEVCGNMEVPANVQVCGQDQSPTAARIETRGGGRVLWEHKKKAPGGCRPPPLNLEWGWIRPHLPCTRISVEPVLDPNFFLSMTTTAKSGCPGQKQTSRCFCGHQKHASHQKHGKHESSPFFSRHSHRKTSPAFLFRESC